MTVETQTAEVTGDGNASATSFSFSPFVIFASTDLVVTLITAAGVETTLTEGTGDSKYSVSVGAYPGTGSVVYPADEVTPIASGVSLHIKRVLTLEQTTDLENQGGYSPEVLEEQLDKIVMMAQQQQETIDRCIKLSPGIANSFDTEIDDSSAGTAGQVLKINTGATGIDLGNSVTTTGTFSLTTTAPMADTGGATPVISIAASSALVPGSMTAAHYTKLENIETAADVTDITNVLSSLAAGAADIAINSQKITGQLDPTGAQDGATKAYVDASIGANSTWKAPVVLATTGTNLTLSGEQTIDGVLSSADRMLVKDQTAGAENGIYVTAAGAWARSTDMDTSAETLSGAVIPVTKGTINADVAFQLTTDAAITLDTTALVFEELTMTRRAPSLAGIDSDDNIVSRRLEDRFAEKYNIVDYGAVEGTDNAATATINNASIQAAIDAAENGTDTGGIPGMVYIPAGIFHISTTLNMNTSLISMVGDGPYISIISARIDLVNDIIHAGDTEDSGTGETTRVAFRDFKIASTATQSAGSALHIERCSRVFVDNVIIGGQDEGASGSPPLSDSGLYHGLWLEETQVAIVNGLDVSVTKDGIRVNGEAGGAGKPACCLFFNGGRILHCLVGLRVGGAMGGAYFDNIDIIANGTNVIIDQTLESETNREIYFGALCSIDSSATAEGVFINDSGGWIVEFTGTWVSTSATSGIHVAAGNTGAHLQFTGGFISNNTTDGILIADADPRILVNGTLIRENGGWGVNATTANGVCTIMANFINNASGNIHADATCPVSQDNNVVTNSNMTITSGQDVSAGVRANLIAEATYNGIQAGPTVFLDRAHSSNPATSTLYAIGDIHFRGDDSAGNILTYGRIIASITDSTNGAETGNIGFETSTAGTTANRMTIGDGLIIGAPSGSYKGAGTVNATAYYLNGNKLDPLTGDINAQTLTLEKNTVAPQLQITSTSTTVTNAPLIRLDRLPDEAGVANDGLADIHFRGYNDAQTVHTFARILAQIKTATAGAEDGRLQFETLVGGSSVTTMVVETGLVMIGATGGDKGSGTINAKAVYDDNVLNGPDYVFEAYSTGTIDLDNPDVNVEKATDFLSRMDRDLDTKEFLANCFETGYMPSMAPGKDSGDHSIGDHTHRLTEALELAIVHIAKLDKRLTDAGL